MKRVVWWIVVLALLGRSAAIAQTVYYNTEGGRYYHTDPRCDSISEKYWNSMTKITREQVQQMGLKGPCQRCVGEQGDSEGDNAEGEEEFMLNAPVMIEYSQADQVFYETCFENARQNMPNPDRDDPEYTYRNQAKYSQEASEGEKKWLAKNGKLFDWATEDDLSRDTSILIGYAALDQIAGIPREQMHEYYAESWLNASDPNRRIWQVHMGLAVEYRRLQEDTASYYVYADAGTGEIVNIKRLGGP